jgi:hypothetical protein
VHGVCEGYEGPIVACQQWLKRLFESSLNTTAGGDPQLYVEGVMRDIGDSYGGCAFERHNCSLSHDPANVHIADIVAYRCEFLPSRAR